MCPPPVTCIKKSPSRSLFQNDSTTYCLVESGLLVVVSVVADRLVVVSVPVPVPVPVVVCGVSHAAIVRAMIATNKMLFISSFFKLIK